MASPKAALGYQNLWANQPKVPLASPDEEDALDSGDDEGEENAGPLALPPSAMFSSVPYQAAGPSQAKALLALGGKSAALPESPSDLHGPDRAPASPSYSDLYAKSAAPQLNLSPLLNFIDQQTGGNSLKGYQAPTSIQDQLQTVAKLKGEEVKQQQEAVKQQALQSYHDALVEVAKQRAADLAHFHNGELKYKGTETPAQKFNQSIRADTVVQRDKNLTQYAADAQRAENGLILLDKPGVKWTDLSESAADINRVITGGARAAVSTQEKLDFDSLKRTWDHWHSAVTNKEEGGPSPQEVQIFRDRLARLGANIANAHDERLRSLFQVQVNNGYRPADLAASSFDLLKRNPDTGFTDQKKPSHTFSVTKPDAAASVAGSTPERKQGQDGKWYVKTPQGWAQE